MSWLFCICFAKAYNENKYRTNDFLVLGKNLLLAGLWASYRLIVRSQLSGNKGATKR
jgi:hypothetical protein